jgi:plastocyanin
MKTTLLLILALVVSACAPLSAAPTEPGHATDVMPTASMAPENVATEPMGGAEDGPTAGVEIKLFGFDPTVLEVSAGTTVTWTNHDDIDHSITSGTPPDTDGTFDSEFFDQGGTYSYTFDTPGEYAYFCKRHNSMTGLVRVVP